MGDNTKIEWTDATFNPWIGCTKVSVGPQGACVNCYAEVATPARAMRIQWGPGKPRHRTGLSTWDLPRRWERNAEAFQAEHGRRQRVFCASLADVFDNEVDPQWRTDLLSLIQQTPHLDWLLLTKRIGNARQMLNDTMAALHHSSWDEWPWTHVWLGATVVTQDEADRDIPKLLATPASVRFLSCEPLLGPVDITEWLWGFDTPCVQCPRDIDCECGWNTRKENKLPSIDLVICGGESGPKARPMDIRWADDLRQQCADANTAFFMKQLGGIRDKGGQLADMPESLRVREFPR
jgi:protein gp37